MEGTRWELISGAGGLLFGGTVWDYVSERRVPAGSLDVLVVDEAGQFSLTNTVAAARAARSVLLLGDPQQLPQVSTGVPATSVSAPARTTPSPCPQRKSPKPTTTSP